MKKKQIKKIIIVLYLFILFTVSVIRYIHGDQLGSTVFLSVGCFILLFKLFKNQKKKKYRQKDGLVLFDERDIELAGKAALFTIRVQMGITGLLVLGLFAIFPKTNIPILILSLHMAFSALLLQITYKFFSKIK